MGNNNRNKPCWCGSGLKYKKCHLDREDQSPVTRADLENHSKQQNAKKLCSVNHLFKSECSKKIINAHTISKSASLKEISENGHVIGIKHSFSNLFQNNGRLTLQEVGINNASTFTGFCSVHDKKLFAPIEDELITLTNKQLFLLAYRGFCRELFHKEQNKKTASFMKGFDRGQDEVIQQIIQHKASSFNIGVDLGLRDLAYIKKEMDYMLISDDYSKIKHCIFELSEKPNMLVSSMVVPEIDFHGNLLQLLGIEERAYQYIFFNCISYQGKGCFVFSWLSENDQYCDMFISSLLKYDYDGISNALVRFCYSFSENTWASPSWWSGLSIEAKNNINDRLMHGTPIAIRPQNCLMDDGINFNALKIVNSELRS